MQLPPRNADQPTGTAAGADAEAGPPARVFLDLTASALLAGEPPTDERHAEVEIARRLLMHPALSVVPVVFDDFGRDVRPWR